MQVSEEIRDTLKEIINIGVGKAAGMLNDLLHSHVKLEVPQIDLIKCSEFSDLSLQMGLDSVSAVRLNFKGAFTGMSSLIFPPESAAKLVDLLTGEESANSDLDAIKIGTLSEVGNILLNAVMGSFSNLLGLRLDFNIPSYMEAPLDAIMECGLYNCITILVIKTRFIVEEQEIEGEVVMIFNVESFDSLIEAVKRVNSDI